eukprot:GEZU01018761.1.p1 GENE.GEZU01018761.1~~GEZU01018761.1.p1  ORF type:complete len:237 (-),score=42.56 GEZU01018761.1:22-732(-)
MFVKATLFLFLSLCLLYAHLRSDAAAIGNGLSTINGCLVPSSAATGCPRTDCFRGFLFDTVKHCYDVSVSSDAYAYVDKNNSFVKPCSSVVNGNLEKLFDTTYVCIIDGGLNTTQSSNTSSSSVFNLFDYEFRFPDHGVSCPLKRTEGTYLEGYDLQIHSFRAKKAAIDLRASPPNLVASCEAVAHETDSPDIDEFIESVRISGAPAARFLPAATTSLVLALSVVVVSLLMLQQYI